MKTLLLADSRGVNTATLEKCPYKVQYDHYPERLRRLLGNELTVDIEPWNLLVANFSKVVSWVGRVVVHLGIVDWTYRSRKSLAKLVADNDLDGLWNDYRAQRSGLIYKGEDAQNLYPVEVVTGFVASIPRIIYVGAMPLLEDFPNPLRTYPRPVGCRQRIAAYDAAMRGNPAVTPIDMSNLTDEEVCRYTIDSVHLTKEGSDYVYERIVECL